MPSNGAMSEVSFSTEIRERLMYVGFRRNVTTVVVTAVSKKTSRMVTNRTRMIRQ